MLAVAPVKEKAGGVVVPAVFSPLADDNFPLFAVHELCCMMSSQLLAPQEGSGLLPVVVT